MCKQCIYKISYGEQVINDDSYLILMIINNGNDDNVCMKLLHLLFRGGCSADS